MTAALDFTLPPRLEADAPPESRGLRRDQVRLLVATAASSTDGRFHELPEHLRPGDLLVANSSATLPSALEAQRSGRRSARVHLSVVLDDGSWVVELRRVDGGTGPLDDGRPGELLQLADGVRLLLVEPYPQTSDGRFWRAICDLEAPVHGFLGRFGSPVRYGYVREELDLGAYQTVFARDPGSAEMPSAGRPFTRDLLRRLVRAGVGCVRITLHTGLSSADDGEPPLPERFTVPAATAARVNATRAAGGRVIAIGTTVTRALESASTGGAVVAASGWTDLVLGGDRTATAVDGIITGWHSPGASHLRLLQAVAGEALVERAYSEALSLGYLWHEFGDSALLLP